MTIEALKAKIHTMCGTAMSTMVLQLRDEGGKLLATLGDDARKLGYYSPVTGCARACVCCCRVFWRARAGCWVCACTRAASARPATPD